MNSDILIPHPGTNLSHLNYSSLRYATFGSIWVVKPTWEVVLKTAAMTLLLLVAIVANAMIIYIVIKCKSLHTPTNLFIFNLALADLLNVSYSSWTLLADDLFQNFVLGPIFCRLDGFVEITCMLASVFSLVVISLDRLLGIVFPFSKRISKRGAIYAILVLWLISASLACPPFFHRKYMERQWADHLEIFCTEESKMRTYWLVLLVILVWIPLTTMTLSYTFIRLKINRYEKIIMNVHNYKTIFASRRKVIKSLYCILLIFFLCWAPFQILIMYRNFRDKNSTAPLPAWYDPVFFVAHYVALANCAINPFVYGITSEKFQSAFRSKFPFLFDDTKPLISRQINNNQSFGKLTVMDDEKQRRNSNLFPVHQKDTAKGVSTA